VSPVSGELWLLYKWDDFCFKTLHSFPRFPQSNFGFAFGNDHTIYMGERKRFLMTVVKRSLEAIEFLHSSGYCHNSLSMESIWLSSLNQVDWRSLRVKLTELGTAQKLSASSGPQAETNITEDFYQLGLILLTLIVACFSDKISKSARTKVLKLGKVLKLSFISQV
jgi:serine/threonine protein kinase